MPAITSLRNAFTLIELLVVIAIMVTLMSLIIAVVSTDSADILATSARIQQVSGSIHSYKMANGVYPLIDMPATNFSDTDISVIKLRNIDLLTKLIPVSSEYEDGGEMVTDIDGEYYLTDSWNMPLVYKPYTAYLTLPSGYATGYKIPKRDSFQIWSAGPDSIYQQNSQSDIDRNNIRDSYNTDDAGYVLYDDITNWMAK